MSNYTITEFLSISVARLTANDVDQLLERKAPIQIEGDYPIKAKGMALENFRTINGKLIADLNVIEGEMFNGLHTARPISDPNYPNATLPRFTIIKVSKTMPITPNSYISKETICKIDRVDLINILCKWGISKEHANTLINLARNRPNHCIYFDNDQTPINANTSSPLIQNAHEVTLKHLTPVIERIQLENSTVLELQKMYNELNNKRNQHLHDVKQLEHKIERIKRFIQDVIA